MAETLKTFLAAGCITLLASCTEIRTDRSVLQERARAYVAAQSEIDPNIARAISLNRVLNGMSVEQVTAAWGNPIEVQTFRDADQQYWVFGHDWPHYCGGLDLGMSEEERYQSQALFLKGKLVDWQS